MFIIIERNIFGGTVQEVSFRKKERKGREGIRKLNYAIFKVAFANFQLGYTY